MRNRLHLAILFLIVALVTAVLGYGGTAGSGFETARLLFWIAIALFGGTLAGGWVRRV